MFLNLLWTLLGMVVGYQMGGKREDHWSSFFFCSILVNLQQCTCSQKSSWRKTCHCFGLIFFLELHAEAIPDDWPFRCVVNPKALTLLDAFVTPLLSGLFSVSGQWFPNRELVRSSDPLKNSYNRKWNITLKVSSLRNFCISVFQ